MSRCQSSLKSHTLVSSEVERSLATFILSIWSRCQAHLKIKSPLTIFPKEKPESYSSFPLIINLLFFYQYIGLQLKQLGCKLQPATDSIPVLGFERLAFVPIFSHWATNMWSSTTVYLSPGW